MPARKRALVLVHSYYLRDTRPRRHASALVRHGWAVDVVCARDDAEPWRETIDGVRVWRLPARRKRGSKIRYIFEYLSFALMGLFVVSALWIARRHRVVYVIGVPNFIVFCALAPRAAGARVLLDIRDPFPEFFRSKYGLDERHPLIRALLWEEKLSARFASQVLTVVPSMRDLYRRSGVEATIIWNAPDPTVFAAASGVHAPDPNDRTMLYTGSTMSHYGLDVAVRAVARLRDEIPALTLRILTKNVDGEQVPALRALALNEGVADRVVFDGPVPLKQIPAEVARAWVGVQPNRADPLMDHSLSQKVLEWVSLGLPVIAGETAPLRHVFTHNELLFHPAGDVEGLCARIREAHADPAGLAARAARARTAAARLGYDEQIERLIAVFEGRSPSERP